MKVHYKCPGDYKGIPCKCNQEMEGVVISGEVKVRWPDGTVSTENLLRTDNGIVRLEVEQ